MRITYVLVLLVGCVAIGGCAQPSGSIGTEAHGDPLHRLHRLIDQREYFEAYIVFIDIRETLNTLDEGAGGYEYQELVGTTSSTGQHDWAKILESPRIPLDLKLDLVREIDRTAKLTVTDISD